MKCSIVEKWDSEKRDGEEFGFEGEKERGGVIKLKLKLKLELEGMQEMQANV